MHIVSQDCRLAGLAHAHINNKFQLSAGASDFIEDNILRTLERQRARRQRVEVGQMNTYAAMTQRPLIFAQT